MGTGSTCALLDLPRDFLHDIAHYYTYVSSPTLMVQHETWLINWNTPEVIVDHWIAKEANSMLNAILP